MLKRFIFSIGIFTALCLLLPIQAQHTLQGIHKINQLIEERNFPEADKWLTADVDYWLDKRQGDSLLKYIRLKGTILKSQIANTKEVLNELEEFVSGFISRDLPDSSISDAYLTLADFASLNNETRFAYISSIKALSFAEKVKNNSKIFIANCEYNLGVYAFRMGNVERAIRHQKTATRLYSELKDIPLQKIYFSQSALASVYWYELKYDSSEYYFRSALETVEKMPRNPVNKYFRRALLNNGLMGISKEAGKIEESIKLGYQVISDYRSFLESSGDDKVKENDAKRGMFEVIDNLGVAYESIGNFKRGEALKLYARQQKEKEFSAGDESVYISDILLGQSYAGQKRNEESIKYLYSGINGLHSDDNDHTFWFGDAYKTLAGIYETIDLTKALTAYDSAFYFFDLAYGKAMDNVYSDFLREKGLFLAMQGEEVEALKTYSRIKDYLDRTSSKNFIEYYYYYHGLAKLHFYSRQYREAITAGNQALSYIDRQYENLKTAASGLDSLKTAFYQPGIMLIKAKSLYELTPERDSLFLVKLFNSLDTAVSIVERRRMLLEDVDNANIMLEDNRDLFDFTSKILLELFEKGNDTLYQHKFIDIRENALLNRIRSRIEQQKAMRFSGVPDSVLQEEQRLKKILMSNGENELSGADVSWTRANSEWNHFLHMLMTDYPVYYKLKFAGSSAMTMSGIKKLLPQDKTLVRYYLLGDRLIVLTVDSDTAELQNLPRSNVDSLILQLTNNRLKEEEYVSKLHELYQIIWKPVENRIKTSGVIVVPDGILYDINPEMLPFDPCETYEQLTSKCLINKYSFSQLYSIRMLEEAEADDSNFRTYVGFTPGFSDDSKEEYISSLTDSLYIDNKYLRLLPQPNNERLAYEFKKRLGGALYSSRSSTVETFQKRADGHKIVHLATHAEFNNAVPEQSGLYFSKRKDEENFFSVKDIYGSSVNSNLTILTACESGRSGYQDGEGFVSLSHAFNYAGSKNILTAIWNIDENASAQITGKFVDALVRGVPTDEALREAKLEYIKDAEGRTLAPSYWSGLVLVGKPLLIQLPQKKSFFGSYAFWIMILSAGVVVIFVFQRGIISHDRKTK